MGSTSLIQSAAAAGIGGGTAILGAGAGGAGQGGSALMAPGGGAGKEEKEKEIKRAGLKAIDINYPDFDEQYKIPPRIEPMPDRPTSIEEASKLVERSELTPEGQELYDQIMDK